MVIKSKEGNNSSNGDQNLTWDYLEQYSISNWNEENATNALVMPKGSGQPWGLTEMSCMDDITKFLVLIPNSWGLSTAIKLINGLQSEDFGTQLFQTKIATLLMLLLYCTSRNKYLFQRKEVRGRKWMMLMPTTPKQFGSKKTSNISAKGICNTISMMDHFG